jgi:hypothetical protein
LLCLLACAFESSSFLLWILNILQHQLGIPINKPRCQWSLTSCLQVE